MHRLLILVALVFVAACKPARQPAAESADSAAQAPRPTGIDSAAQASDTAGQRPDTTRRDSVP